MENRGGRFGRSANLQEEGELHGGAYLTPACRASRQLGWWKKERIQISATVPREGSCINVEYVVRIVCTSSYPCDVAFKARRGRKIWRTDRASPIFNAGADHLEGDHGPYYPHYIQSVKLPPLRSQLQVLLVTKSLSVAFEDCEDRQFQVRRFANLVRNNNNNVVSNQYWAGYIDPIELVGSANWTLESSIHPPGELASYLATPVPLSVRNINRRLVPKGGRWNKFPRQEGDVSSFTSSQSLFSVHHVNKNIDFPRWTQTNT